MAGANKVYVGNLNPRATERDVEEAFGRYGKLASVWVARRPPGFAFIEFEDRRDAEDAIKAMDRQPIMGQDIRVEFARTESGPRRRFNDQNGGFPGRDDRGYDRGFDRGNDRGYDRGRGRDDRDDRYRRSPSPRRGASPPPPPVSRGREGSRSRSP